MRLANWFCFFPISNTNETKTPCIAASKKIEVHELKPG